VLKKSRAKQNHLSRLVKGKMLQTDCLHTAARAMVSSTALACGLTQYFGYVILSTIIERVYYVRGASTGTTSTSSTLNNHARKIQREVQARGTTRTSAAAPWGFPLYQLCTRASLVHGSEEHARHRVFASINLLVSSCFAACVGESVAQRYSTLRAFGSYASTKSYTVDFVFGWFKAMALQSVVEYYWHVWMHSKAMYKRVHKIHHTYKAPSVWCDLCIHPIEAFGYYCILYSPGFVVSMPIGAFVLYMAVNGVCGVLDHCGIKLRVPFVYDTQFHDLHHKYFEVNYAFPFDFMDRIHGTYRAPDSPKTG